MKQVDFIESWVESTNDAVKNGYLAFKPNNLELYAQHCWATKLNVENQGEDEFGFNGLFDAVPLATGELVLPEIVTPLMIAQIAVYLSEAEDPVLMVNSGGGDFYAGLATANIVRQQGSVSTLVTGQAFSAASIIVAAGAERTMALGTTIGIHRVSSVFTGNVEELRVELRELEMLDGTLAEFYARVGTAPAERFAKLMEADTRMTFAQARRLGLVDVEGTGESVDAQKEEEEEEERRRRRRRRRRGDKGPAKITAHPLEFHC